MSRPEGAARTSGRRRDTRTEAPLRVAAERLPQHGVAYDTVTGDDPAAPVTGPPVVALDAAIPRARPATGRLPAPSPRPHTVMWSHPALIPPPAVPAPPLASLTGDGGPVGGAPLPVLAPIPLRRRLRLLLRMWIPARRRGRHRTGAPHLRDSWSMFAPQGRPRRRVRLR